jgi:hypothetical protein
LAPDSVRPNLQRSNRAAFESRVAVLFVSKGHGALGIKDSNLLRNELKPPLYEWVGILMVRLF